VCLQYWLLEAASVKAVQTSQSVPAGYGPLDQGAFNQFYEDEIKGRPIHKNFNAMMFHQFRPGARIVHMNG
jgi:hypothetical protein